MTNCKDCKTNCVYRGKDNESRCRSFVGTVTNGDHIRAMTDEELADNWMRDFVICHRCAYRYECECDEYVTYEKCREGIVEWHKQPVEGE